MIRLLLAAPASGTGKTTVTMALLGALKRRGLNPCSFKCGPDYIDPMFHRSVLGVDCHNLDLFLSDEDTVRDLYARGAAGHDAVVCEGAMGLYDGLGGTTDRASAWHVAHTLDLPVILVIRPKGASLTLAAQIKGLDSFRQPSHIAGIILNDCKPMLAKSLTPMLEQETGLPVLGCMPRLEQVEIQSRHLGLYTAGEIADINQRIDLLATQLEETVDVDRLLALCTGTAVAAPTEPILPGPGVPIAVAQDEAFCFTYREALEALERAGAEIISFSPIHDHKLPEHIGGLYLPGGYPELYVKELSENTSMLSAIKAAIADGLPTVAECGGFLYLGKTLADEDDHAYPMVSTLPGEAAPAGKLVRFGYHNLIAKTDSLLFQSGDVIPIHEFHYWDSTANGTDLDTVKPTTGRKGACGFVSDTLYAGFPHLYLASQPKMVARFVEKAKEYAGRN